MSHRDIWNERYAGRELVWSAGPNAQFAQAVATLPPGTALDVACGEGRNALWLAEQGWAVTAIDFSEVAIDKARRIAERRGLAVDWQVADLAAEPLPADAYDLSVVLYLHTDPAERARWLASVVRSVRRGGTFLYIGHDPSNIHSGIGGPQRPELLPSAHEISAALSGFTIEQAQVTERSVTADPGHGGPAAGVALDTFVRAVRMR